MEKDFVPSNLSLELKGLNFDKPCFGRYYYKESYPMLNPNSGETELVFEFGQYIKQTEITILAPTFSQAFRFFSEKYGLFISFTRYKNSVVIEMPDTFSKVYEIWIQDENEDESIWVGGFGEHGEAELACLIKLIEIVKNK